MKFAAANFAYYALSFATIISLANAGFWHKSEQIEYSGLILSAIRLKHLPCGKEFDDLIDGDEVSFTERSKTGKKAVFLKDIVQTKIVRGRRTFKAEFVSPEKAYELVKKGYNTTLTYTGKDKKQLRRIPYGTPLFCVHGFKVQPSELFKEMAKARQNFLGGMKFYPIPVLWSTGPSLFDYLPNQSGSSLEAGRLLNALIHTTSNDLFSEKSLMMHSMGNHVVLNGVLGLDEEAPGVRFDNIFMVAAVSTTGISSNVLILCRFFFFQF
jgi:hypothetical protein